MKAIRRFGRRFSTILAGSAPLLLAQEALAGSSVGNINHATLADVPALGGIGLLLLSGLLGVVSLRFMKAREKGRFIAIAVLAGAVASAGGVNIVKNAEASIAGINLFFNETSVQIPFPGYHIVTNRSGGSRQITQIDLVDGCVLGDLENGGRNGGLNGGLMNGGAANGGMLINGGGNGGNFLGECSDNPGTRMQADDFCEILVCCGGPNGGNGGPNGGNGGCFIL